MTANARPSGSRPRPLRIAAALTIGCGVLVAGCWTEVPSAEEQGAAASPGDAPPTGELIEGAPSVGAAGGSATSDGAAMSDGAGKTQPLPGGDASDPEVAPASEPTANARADAPLPWERDGAPADAPSGDAAALFGAVAREDDAPAPSPPQPAPHAASDDGKSFEDFLADAYGDIARTEAPAEADAALPPQGAVAEPAEAAATSGIAAAPGPDDPDGVSAPDLPGEAGPPPYAAHAEDLFSVTEAPDSERAANEPVKIVEEAAPQAPEDDSMAPNPTDRAAPHQDRGAPATSEPETAAPGFEEPDAAAPHPTEPSPIGPPGIEPLPIDSAAIDSPSIEQPAPGSVSPSDSAPPETQPAPRVARSGEGDRPSRKAAIAGPDQPDAKPIPAMAGNTRHNAWLFGAKLALAGVADMDGAPPEDVERWERETQELAAKLRVAEPEFGAAFRATRGGDRLRRLLGDAGTASATLAGRYGRDHAALVEVALKTNLLLAVVKQRPELAAPTARAAASAADRADLPLFLWEEPLRQLEEAKTQEQAEQAVGRLHARVEAFLR